MRIFLALFILIACLGICQAAENPILGNWNIISVDDQGRQQTWTLSVKEEDGKLAATLRGEQDDMVINVSDPKFEGNTFSFKIRINENETVAVTMKLSGNKLDGTYEGKESGKGTVKGTRAQVTG